MEGLHSVQGLLLGTHLSISKNQSRLMVRRQPDISDRSETAEQSAQVLEREAEREPIEHQGTLHDHAHSTVKCNRYLVLVNQ